MKIYLATHYSDPDADVRQSRTDEIGRIAARLMVAGHVVFSPVSHGHGIAPHLPDESAHNHEFWMGQDLPFIQWCDSLVVYPPEAFTHSRGVRCEVREANRLGRSVIMAYDDALNALCGA